MSFDFSTLITDRAQSDLDALRDLLATPMADWTAEQLAAFNQAASKGAYNYTDLNRVAACMDYLNERLTAAGYETGYQRIQVPHQNGESRLPQGYTELQYIHKSGNAYINTGFVPAWDSGIEMTIAIHQVSDYSAPFGARSSNSVTDAYSNLLFIAPAGQPRSDYYGDSIDFQASIPFGQVLTISQRSNVVSVGTQTETHQTSARSSAYPWFLLDVNTAGEPRQSGEFDLYSCKIYDGETLIRDFVPCRNPEGIIGLYDLKNKLFYANAGIDPFIAGPEVAQSESSYTQIEWLGFSGAQYIDTGLRGTQNTRFITHFRNDQTPNSAIFGADGGWQINGFGIWVNTQIIAPVFGSQTGSIGLTFSSELDEIQLDSTGVRFNGSQVWSVSGATPFTTPTNLSIGAVNRAGTIYEQFVGRIGKTSIEESGITVREYIPVRDPDGALGMYDTINNVFVPNSGSGVFSSGPVVPGSPDLPEPEPGPDPYTWYESDTPTASLMDEYLSNVSALRAVLDLPETTPEVPADMDRLTQAEANDIEDILGIIHTYLLALQSILRRCGADITRVRKMFRDDMASYRAKAEAMRKAEVYREEFAIAQCPSNIDSPTVLAAQTANELLDISGIKASFVLTIYDGKIYLSARSIDEVNVQIIAEKLGGGGHINSAGAQFDHTNMDEAIKALKATIDQMIEEGDI